MTVVKSIEYYTHLSPEMQQNDAEMAYLLYYIDCIVKQNVRSIRVRNIYRSLLLPEPSQVKVREAIAIGELLEQAGYIFAPDIRMHGIAFDINDSIYIMRGKNPPLHDRFFKHLCTILQVGATIAQSDHDIALPEVHILQNIILSRENLTKEQQVSLLLWLEWCLNTKQDKDVLEKNLSHISDEFRNLIQELIMQVACADGKITMEEYRCLILLHRALHLPASNVDESIASHHCEIITDSQLGPQPAIPDDSLIPIEIIDNINKKEADTPSLSENLNRIIDSLDDVESTAPHCQNIDNTDVAPKTQANAPYIDNKHFELLQKISRKPSLSRLELFKMAVDCNLMADYAMKHINEVATKQLGEIIIQDGDPVLIDTVCAKQLLHALSYPS